MKVNSWPRHFAGTYLELVGIGNLIDDLQS